MDNIEEFEKHAARINSSKAPVEPRSDFRQAAAGMFEMFTSFVDAGFTEMQALTIVGFAMHSGGK